MYWPFCNILGVKQKCNMRKVHEHLHLVLDQSFRKLKWSSAEREKDVMQHTLLFFLEMLLVFSVWWCAAFLLLLHPITLWKWLVSIQFVALAIFASWPAVLWCNIPDNTVEYWFSIQNFFYWLSCRHYEQKHPKNKTIENGTVGCSPKSRRKKKDQQLRTAMFSEYRNKKKTTSRVSHRFLNNDKELIIRNWW